MKRVLWTAVLLAGCGTLPYAPDTLYPTNAFCDAKCERTRDGITKLYFSVVPPPHEQAAILRSVPEIQRQPYTCWYLSHDSQDLDLLVHDYTSGYLYRFKRADGNWLLLQSSEVFMPREGE